MGLAVEPWLPRFLAAGSQSKKYLEIQTQGDFGAGKDKSCHVARVDNLSDGPTSLPGMMEARIA